jgi:hypothetical protein
MSSLHNAKQLLQGVLRRGYNNGKLAIKTFKEFPTHNKIGLGIGVTGLGLSIANYRRNNANMELNQERVELDKESLTALQKIHKALLRKPKPVIE